MNASTGRDPSSERPAGESKTKDRLGRLMPLAGIGFAGVTISAFLLMGKYPDADVPSSEVTSFYAAHHAHVLVGGMLLAYAAILFALFGAAVWARIDRAGLHPIVAGAALVGTAVATAGQLFSATTYYVLGDIRDTHTISTPALQALHIAGSELSLPIAGGTEILLLAFASPVSPGERSLAGSLGWRS